MSKNIYITESQLKKFKELETVNKLSPSLLHSIDDDSSPLSFSTSLNKKRVKEMLYDGYVNAISNFKDDITHFTEDEISNKLLEFKIGRAHV